MISVDPRNFRSFCFRGEGRANVVISAKNRTNGTRIVWRFAKARKSGLVTFKAKSELVNRYMENMVSPFFSPIYLVSPMIIEMSVNDVHQLAKIPSLPANMKIESFEELSNLPTEMSLLPLASVPKGVVRISALEMLDATQIPEHISSFNGSTITVEIKPKQGFFQMHPGVGLPFCNNCVLQLEKCGSDHFTEMYDFCPLDIFSGSEVRVSTALRELFRNPHRNLRVFVDGNVVHSDDSPLDQSLFDSTLFPSGLATTDSVISALSLILTGSSSPDAFGLHEDSVLGQILTAQQIDTIGIVRAYQIYQALPADVQRLLLDKSRLSSRGLQVLESSDARSLVERYLLAATMKDCSIMASLRLLPYNENLVSADSSNDVQVVRLNNGMRFAYSIKVVDLDPKSPKNLVNAYARFMAGVKIIRLENAARRPCIHAT